MSGLKGHHQLEEFTIVERKFTTQEYKLVVQKNWPMVTKSSEEKKFDSQIATLSEEIKNSLTNIKKYQKMTKKSYFSY